MREMKQLQIPEELREEMRELPEVNWSLVIRRSLKQELKEISELKKIVSKSELTQQDAKEISDKINESLSKRFRDSIKG